MRTINTQWIGQQKEDKDIILRVYIEMMDEKKEGMRRVLVYGPPIYSS